MIDIALVATNAWTVIQPYLPILATKTAEAVGGSVPPAIGKVWKTVEKKFDTKAAAKEALEDLLKSPDDTDAQAAFRQQLKKLMAEDEIFATELSKLLEAAGDTYKASLTGDGAIAQGTGAKAVGKGGVMIGGDVTGNINTGSDSSVDDHEKKKR
jgi:hypothetical protein